MAHPDQPAAGRADRIEASRDQLAMMPWLRVGDGYLTIEVNARPSSRKKGFLRIAPNGPVLGLLSAPEKGRANRELVEFVAEILNVPIAAVSIIRGHGSRQKVVRVETPAPRSLAAALADLVSGL